MECERGSTRFLARVGSSWRVRGRRGRRRRGARGGRDGGACGGWTRDVLRYGSALIVLGGQY